MGRIYQLINSLGRSTIAFNSCDRANTNDLDRHSLPVDGKLAPTSKMVRPYIQVHVSNSSPILITLSIYIPEYFKPQTATVQIIKRHLLDLEPRLQTISAIVSFQGRWLQIKFKNPIFPDTKLQINFNPIDINMYYKLPEYFVYSKSVDGQNSFISRGYFKRAD